MVEVRVKVSASLKCEDSGVEAFRLSIVRVVLSKHLVVEHGEPFVIIYILDPHLHSGVLITNDDGFGVELDHGDSPLVAHAFLNTL